MLHLHLERMALVVLAEVPLAGAALLVEAPLAGAAMVVAEVLLAAVLLAVDLILLAAALPEPPLVAPPVALQARLTWRRR